MPKTNAGKDLSYAVLPTNEDVVDHFYYVKNSSGLPTVKTNREICKIVAEKVTKVWERASTQNRPKRREKKLI